MTPSEIHTERTYLLTERLGIMCGLNKPSPEQLQEAKAWVDSEITRILASERSKDTEASRTVRSGASGTM